MEYRISGNRGSIPFVFVMAKVTRNDKYTYNIKAQYLKIVAEQVFHVSTT